MISQRLLFKKGSRRQFFEFKKHDLIVKKHGGAKASTDEELKKDLIEEMADVLMYYNDVMLCYGITVDELKQAYTENFETNMKRW